MSNPHYINHTYIQRLPLLSFCSSATSRSAYIQLEQGKSRRAVLLWRNPKQAVVWVLLAIDANEILKPKNAINQPRHLIGFFAFLLLMDAVHQNHEHVAPQIMVASDLLLLHMLSHLGYATS
jgi:hypothetical protein